MMLDDFTSEGLSGLHEGLCVRHIANSPLVTCEPGDDFESLFLLPQYKDFDQLPIKQGTKIVGVVERSSPKTQRVLDDSLLVGADTSLLCFIHTVHEQSYRLVVEGTAINGIVTWSDLLKLPVIVVAFSLIARLECAMNKRIKEMYGGHEGWLDLLDEKSRSKIARRTRQLERENLVLPKEELADLSDKATVLRQLISTAQGHFELELRNVTDLRNKVMHMNDIVGSADLRNFVKQVETAEAWVGILQGQRSLPAAAG
jgi:hypothetical protein